jgi:ribosomal protein S18 acetylase RimI-like enzyme
MMLVDPQYRGLGLGSQLMSAAMSAVASESCVRLDATPAGEPLYRRYGFIPEYTLARMKTTAGAERLQPAPGGARRMERTDLARVFARDREVFGADRSALLASFYQRAPELAWIATKRAETVGYCFGRPGYRYAHLGPVVAEHPEVAHQLLAHCLPGQDGKDFALDVCELTPEWIAGIEAAGFQQERTFLRMRHGESEHQGLPEKQFAIAGPEFG